MISHRYRFVFLHPLASGGEAVERAFPGERRRCEQELRAKVFAPGAEPRGRVGASIWTLTAEDLRHYYGETFDGYFRFAVVRNPWDRLVADFVEPRLRHRRGPDDELSDLHVGFRSWLSSSRVAILERLLTQTEHLAVDGKPAVDFVARFERLRTDFAEACRRLGLGDRELPRWPGPVRGSYADFYDDTTRELVAEMFADDVEAYGYAFGVETHEPDRPEPSRTDAVHAPSEAVEFEHWTDDQLAAEVRRLRRRTHGEPRPRPAARTERPAARRSLTRREALAAWMSPALSSLQTSRAARRSREEARDGDPALPTDD